MNPTLTRHRELTVAAYLAAASFGTFWGTWGASVPRLREQAHVDDGQLGVALLFVGLGALPAMLLTGRALDRWGLRFAVAAIVALGLSGFGVAITAQGYGTLCAGLVLVGLASGATDVAMNSIAGRAEKSSGTSVILRSGGVFSSFVVLSSIGTGLSSWASAPIFTPFLVVAILSVAAGVSVLRSLPTARRGSRPTSGLSATPTSGPSSLPHADGSRGGLLYAPLAIAGALGALAFASENAHQSWGAVFLEDEFGAGGGMSSVAPAVFAGVVAVTRFSLARLPRGNEGMVIVVGSLTAAAGASVIAMSSSIIVAILGLTVAAVGTAALYPTLLSLVSREVNEGHRGRATAIVTTISYIGFILGPVYVGLWSDAIGLRGALLAIAALGLVLAALAVPLLRAAGLVRTRA